MLLATLVLLAGYSLLPEHYRFSRGIILFGALLAFLLMSLLRWFLVRVGVLNGSTHKQDLAGTLIVGSEYEYENARKLMQEAGMEERVLGRIGVQDAENGVIGYHKNLQAISQSIPYREIIFCEGGLSFEEIIGSLNRLSPNTSIKFHASGTGSIVGSDSKDSLGESVSLENGYNLSDPYNRRMKRLIDIIFSVLVLITFPLYLFVVRRPFHFLGQSIRVLLGQLTWVGYTTPASDLPFLRPAVFGPNGLPLAASKQLPSESLRLLDYWYAKDYEPGNDIKLLWKTYLRG